MTTPQRGRLICFEGLDGAGKSTAARGLAEALRAQGKPVVFVAKKSTDLADPRLADRMRRLKALIWDYGDTPIDLLGDRHSLFIMAAWFAAFDQIVVRPLIAEGRIVIVDNWCHKFIARFQLKQTVDLAQVRDCFSALSVVDRTYFLDIDVAEAGRRKSSYSQAETGNLDGFHGRTRQNFERYQIRVRQAYLEMAERQEWVVISATGLIPVDVVKSVLRDLSEAA